MTSYKQAIEWIALQDDTSFLDDAAPIICVTGSMVADLWGKSEDRVIHDLRLALKRIHDRR